MSNNNKESIIYQCIKLLSQGVNNLNIQTTIINAYEKVVRKNIALKEHIKKIVLDLQDKKKIISNLEKENIAKDLLINKLGVEKFELENKISSLKTISKALMNSDIKELLEKEITEQSNYILTLRTENESLQKENNEISNAFASLLDRDLLQENEDLKEINRNIFNVGKQIEQENKTLRETNKNLLEISKKLEEERDYYKLGSDNSRKCNENLRNENYKLKFEFDALKRERDRFSEYSAENKILKEENEKLKQKIKDLDMKMLKESLNKAMWHNTYEADIQALKGNLDCTNENNKHLKEENEKLKQKLYSIRLEIELCNLHPLMTYRLLKCYR